MREFFFAALEQDLHLRRMLRLRCMRLELAVRKLKRSKGVDLGDVPRPLAEE